MLRPAQVESIKAMTALAGTLLLVAGAALDRTGRAQVLRRSRDGALLALGLLGALCWWNLLQFHYPGYAHPRDNFHYYLGAKYFPELGYARLYACATVADREAGARAEPGRIRNLETNALESAAAVLAEPERCKRHFSQERWAAFARDVGWMRGRLPARRWRAIQMDHGYNASPAWTLVGRALTSAGPISSAQLRALTLLDPLLLLAAWGCVAWAFGWRTLCVALLFWGTNYFAPYGWTGGGILRQDWLAASVAGICLLRRDRPALAGALLAWAALSRVFPALLLAGVALGVLARSLAARRLLLSGAQRRLALGALATALAVVPLSGLAAGERGLAAWLDFARNSRLHLSTPLQNHVGLRTLLAHREGATARQLRDAALEDPFAPWKRARAETAAARLPLFLALVAAFAVLLARAAARQADWVAALLGAALVPVALELTSYYWALLVVFALSFAHRPGIGAALVALSAASWGVVAHWHWYDEVFTWASAAALATVLYAVLALLRRPITSA